MSKLNLIALIVISSMTTGYRRAGIALEQGENRLADVNEAQYHLLNDDPNLAVSVDEQENKLDVTPDVGGDLSAQDNKTKNAVKTTTTKKAPVKKTQAK